MVRVGPRLARLAKAYAEAARRASVADNVVRSGVFAGESGAAAANLQLVRGQAQAALQEAVRVEPRVAVVPEITTDLFGAVSPVSNEQIQEGLFKNIDGQRFDDGRYTAFR